LLFLNYLVGEISCYPWFAKFLLLAINRNTADIYFTPHQIQSFAGHKILKKIERYTAVTNQKLLAGQSRKKIKGSK